MRENRWLCWTRLQPFRKVCLYQNSSRRDVKSCYTEELRIESDRAQYVKQFGRFAGLVQSLDVFDLYRPSRQDRPQTHRWKTLKKKVFELMPFTSDKKPSPFPAVDDAAITSHAAAELRHRGRLGVLRRQIWLFFIKLKSADVRYALKTGIGGGLLGAFAFNHVSRPIFVQYSGNWAVLSVSCGVLGLPTLTFAAVLRCDVNDHRSHQL